MSIALNLYYKGKNGAAKMFMEEINERFKILNYIVARRFF